MLIKAADERLSDIAALRALLERPGLGDATRSRIDQELRNIQAGFKGEREAAYEIEFLLGANKNQATIHDLRIEVDGRVAQIDHLIVDRVLGITVCESKHFSHAVTIDEHGEWTTHGRGIASPIEQNRRHTSVLKDLFDRGLVKLPTRLGITMKPRLYSLILIATDARIDRPKGRAAKRVKGLDTVIKTDQLPAALDRLLDGRELDLVKLMSRSRMERLARDLAALHRPIQIDWAARFGVRDELQTGPVPLSTRTAGTMARCDSCGVPVSHAERRYCQDNSAHFADRILCFACQRTPARILGDRQGLPASNPR